MFVSGFEDLNQVPGYCSEFSFVTCCFSARLSIGKISPLHASTAAESALLVNQILLPHLHKLLQPVLPILRNPPRILPRPPARHTHSDSPATPPCARS